MTVATSPARVPRRLLFLCPFPPRRDAIHGGARVMTQLLQSLAGRHPIAVIYLREGGEPPIDDVVAATLVSAHEVRLPQRVPLTQRLARRSASLRGIPAWASYTSVAEFADRVREVASSWKPDIVHFEYHVIGQYAPALPDRRAARILTEYEAGVLAAREHATTTNPGTLGARLEQQAWTRFERRVISRMDTVVVFSERDQAALAPVAGATPIVRIGIGMQLPASPLDPLGATDHPRLLFVGNFRHPPNVDAALRLADSIFPAVRTRIPGAVLRIVGAHPTPELLSRSGNGVDVTGRVPDVTPWMNAAAVVVVPLRVGGGMRVKVIEALAHGKAVVASPRAIEGLAVADGRELAVAESDDEFVSRIVELLGAPTLRATLARNARDWACANLGEDRWVAEYEALYDRLRPGSAAT